MYAVLLPAFGILLGRSHAQAVQAQGAIPLVEKLPESPGSVRAYAAVDAQAIDGTGSISGVVADRTGAALSGALVKLTGLDGRDVRAIRSSDHGEFVLDKLGQGPFRLLVTADGFDPFVSEQIALRAGQVDVLPEIDLRVATAVTMVTVTPPADEMATEQVKAQERQRIFGVLPNFYTSYVRQALPLGHKQKISLAVHAAFDPTEAIAPMAQAGFEQANNSFPGYGQGWKGYGKRYGASYGDQLAGRFLSYAILPIMLHQDPRYFYQGTGTKRARAWYAIRSAFVTRTDKGGRQPNYSFIGGDLASGGLANLYYPHADRGGWLVARNTAIATAAHAADNLMQEFVLKRFTSNTPASVTSDR